jgi:sortase A
MTLDVAHAEYAGGGPGYALVRLIGRASAEVPSRLAPPTLLIADDAQWRRLAAVPGTPLITAGPGDGHAFTIAFEIPLHLALGDGAWWLEPGPVVRAARAPDPRVGELVHRGTALGTEITALRKRIARDAERAEPAPTATPAVAASPTAPSPAAAPVPRTSRLRALRPTLPALLVATGALVLGDAVATVAWQEPLSALWANHEQHALAGDLARLDAAYEAPGPTAGAAVGASPNATPSTATATAKMRTFAQRLEHRASPAKPLGELRIPRLQAHFVVVQGTGSGSLRRGPGHYLGTALPGEPGTVGIAGHRTTYGAPFRHLDALRRGDALTITMPYGRFVYRVEGTRIVQPQDVSSLRSAGPQRLVLTACHPLYSAAQRLVVLARLEQATPRGAAAANGDPAAPSPAGGGAGAA